MGACDARKFKVQVRRLGQIRSVEAFAGAVVEQNRVANCIPDRRQPDAARPMQSEVQAARFAVPP